MTPPRITTGEGVGWFDPRWIVIGIIIALAVYAVSPVHSNYTTERWEQEDGRGCALFLAAILGLVAFIFWDVP